MMKRISNVALLILMACGSEVVPPDDGSGGMSGEGAGTASSGMGGTNTGTAAGTGGGSAGGGTSSGAPAGSELETFCEALVTCQNKTTGTQQAQVEDCLMTMLPAYENAKAAGCDEELMDFVSCSIEPLQECVTGPNDISSVCNAELNTYNNCI